MLPEPEFKFYPHRGNCSHTTGIARMKDVLSHVSWHQITGFGTSEAHCASLLIWSLVIPMGLAVSYINDGHAGALLAKSSNQLQGQRDFLHQFRVVALSSKA